VKIDLRSFDKASAMVIRRAEETLVAEYRDVAREIFWRILNETPQFTGRATAHWQVGIDAPDLSYQDDSVGKVVNMLTGRHKKNGQFYKADSALSKGHQDAVMAAWARNEHKFDLIKRRSKVFFSNNVQGDTDGGKSSENYITSLQESGYWVEKLRGVNKPYETVAETIMLVQLARSPTGRGPFTFRGSRQAFTNL